jgi:hypothetical protein
MTGSRAVVPPRLPCFSEIAVARGSYVHGGRKWWAEPDQGAAVDARRRAAACGADALAACARPDIMRTTLIARASGKRSPPWRFKLRGAPVAENRPAGFLREWQAKLCPS